jgi:cytochrome P450
MTTETAALLDQWAAADRQSIDILAEMLRLTRRIILRILFGSEADDLASALQGPLTELVCATERRVWGWFSLPLAIATPASRRFRRALRLVDDFILGAVDRRRRHGSDGADMLGALLGKMDHGSGEPHRLRALRDEVITMIIAGHTTTAAALAWVWVLLAQHPQVQARLHAEIDSVLRGAPPSAVTLGTLRYTRAVVMEALRLYPPTWLTARCAVAADRCGAHSIPAGSVLLICPYTLHRHPGYWSAPDSFDPGRFLGQEATGRTSYSYLVFGGGPRRCIGQGLAMLEMQLIVAITAQRFRLHLAEDSVVTPHARITLRPEGARMVAEPLAAIRATSALPGHLAVARNR